MGWYGTGFVEPEIQQYDGPGRIRRYYLPLRAEDRELTFIDDTAGKTMFDVEGKKMKLQLPFRTKEHQVKIGGDWRNWFTCVGPEIPCPLCDAGNRSSQIAVFTVIDHQEWEDKKGTKHKDDMKLFVCKLSSTVYRLLMKQSTKREGLRGCRFSVSRLAEKSSNVGDTFEFMGKTDLPVEVQPLNYFEAMKPAAQADLRRALSALSVETEAPVSLSVEDDDFPI